ncbi:MAG: efflux RND transporter permease subunit [Candidatus Gracilibacteria bacterium]|nr:efflux RND transporter permease subunit [Candidatus Gracilibacteria bacterium]
MFAILIIIISFVPIFALEGQEGKLFSPLAFTNMFAMIGALFSSLFLAPVLCIFFLKGKLKKDSEIPVVRFLQKIYKPILIYSLKKRKVVLGISGILLVIGLGLFTKIGSEFMPPLDEGSIMYMLMTVPNVSDRRARDLLIESNKIISEIPEVEKVVGKAGRALTATDPAPLAMLETIITLKPKSEWREGITKSDIINEMNGKIKINNLWNGFTQPIIGRIDMLSTGIRAQVGVKIFGDDPMILEELAIKTEELLGNVPGGFGTTAIRTTGLKYLKIDLDETKLTQYSIKKGDVLDTIAIGIGGTNVTTTISGREKYSVELRLNNNFRESLDDIKSLEVPSKSGNIVLSQVANISLEDGPATINSENGVMRSAVQMNVVGIDLVTFVDNGRKYIDENLELPEGYFVKWTGQYENQLRAKNTLKIVVPTVILIILFILFLAYKDVGLVAIVASSIPFSLVGGIIALFISGFNLFL